MSLPRLWSLCVLMLACSAALAAAEVRYLVHDLGNAFPVRLEPQASTAAGSLQAGVAPNQQQHAARLSVTQAPVDLGTLPQGTQSRGNAINAGRLVGYSSTGPNGLQTHAFLLAPGTGMQDLGTLPGGNVGGFSSAIHLNGAGTIVGTSDATLSMTLPTVWIDGAPTALPTLGGPRGVGLAINELGDIAGDSARGTGGTHATLWPIEGGVMDLDPTGSPFSGANDLTNDRRIVGVVNLPGALPFLFTTTTGFQLLPLLPGALQGQARAINEAGQIAGDNSGSGPFPPPLWAVLWENGQPVDLNTRIDAPGWVLEVATDINERGWILGTGTLDGAPRAFVLEPIGEPIFLTQVVGDLDGDGQEETIGLATNQRVWRKQPGGTWTRLPGFLKVLVGGDFYGDGRLSLAGIGIDDGVYFMDDGVQWQDTGGAARTLLASHILDDHRAALAAIGFNGGVWVWDVDTGWRGTAGYVTQLVAANIFGGPRDILVGIALGDVSVWAMPQFAQWQPLPAALYTLGTRDVNGDGLVDLVGLGLDYEIWISLSPGGGWQPLRQQVAQQ